MTADGEIRFRAPPFEEVLYPVVLRGSCSGVEPERSAIADALALEDAAMTRLAGSPDNIEAITAFVATIEAIRRRTPGVQVEVLIPDCGGDEEALATARLAAVQSAVLLKNEHDALPLVPERLGSLAVIGPLADAPHDQLGTWTGGGGRAGRGLGAGARAGRRRGR